MSQLPSISNAFVIPGASASETCASLLVGFVVDERQIAWGECVLHSAVSNPESQLNDATSILQEIIIPSLMGQPLVEVPRLMEQIDRMQHQVTLIMPVTVKTPPQRRSRRELFTSLLNPAEEIREVVERPLPPELRHGVSQALLSAAAAAQGISIVELAAEFYDLAPASSPLPIHLVFDDLPNPTDPALSRITAASYGLAVGDDPLKELGKDGIRLQNRVRQLKNRAVRHMDGGQPASSFLFNLKGGYGMMYQEKTGAVLGALFGLEQVVKPYTLRLVDPIIAADKQSQIEEMKKLQSYLRMRKMKTQLIGQTWIETAEDVHAFADNDCCIGVLLDMVQLGTVHQTIKLAQAARERNLDIILAGAVGNAAVHTAIALNPTLLVVGTADISTTADEIIRTLAWRGYQ